MGIYSEGRVADLSSSYDSFESMLAHAEDIRRPSEGAGIDDSNLLPPVGRTSKFLCMAFIYLIHIDVKLDAPSMEPLLFTKFYSSLTGAYAVI